MSQTEGSPKTDALKRFAAASRRGFVFDFDGTLSEIVARPELAEAAPGAAAVLSRLASDSPLVAVVTGRPAAQVRGLLVAPGVQVVGVFGLERRARPGSEALRAARAEVELAAGAFDGAWVEDKGVSLAVHYREVEDPARAERDLGRTLREIAASRGLHLFPAKRALELTAGERPGKGTVVRDLCRAADVDGCLFAGDDLVDLDAFRALDELAAEGMATVKVAVRSEETPAEVLSAADVVVDRPAGLIRLLAAAPIGP